MKNNIVVLSCGGSGCCPEIKFNDDETVDIYDHDGGKNDNVHLNKEQALKLFNALKINLSK